MSGMMQRSQYRAQASLARRQADAERVQAEMRADEMRRHADQLRGRQAALSGAAGVDLIGTPVDILADTSANMGRDIYNTRFLGEQRALNLEASAANLNQSGNNAMFGSLLGAAGNMAMSGFGQSLFAGSGSGSSVSAGSGQRSGDYYNSGAY